LHNLEDLEVLSSLFSIHLDEIGIEALIVFLERTKRWLRIHTVHLPPLKSLPQMGGYLFSVEVIRQTVNMEILNLWR